MKRWPQWVRMQLARATALIAVLFIVILSAGYASAEREPATVTVSQRAS